jgi:cytochrome o ubiquinol oxidase subunit III
VNSVALAPGGHHGESHARGHGAGGPASKRIVVGYGFWIYLISDIILFSALFATYAVLAPATAGGPSAKQLFDINSVAIETACLLASSFACGMASIAVSQRSMKWTQISLVITGLLGFVFLLLAWSRADSGRPAAPFCRRSSPS